MTTDCNIRPRRSVLYVPGSNPRALAKARQLPADGLILDLEDAVLPEHKDAARERVMAAIAAREFGPREVAVRVNGIDTPWFAADIAAVAASAAHAIVLPKVSDAGVVREASARLGWLRAHAGLDIWIMAETAGGILRLGAIGAASPRVRVIVMGTADLASALRTPPDPGRNGLLAALGLCVLGARAQGLDILDGVYPDVTDVAGFTAECRQGKALGFDGKTLIHPGQIGAANDAFGVSAEAARTATAVIAAYEEAAARGSGIALLEGRMVEKLHADEARRLLALHQATGAANARQD